MKFKIVANSDKGEFRETNQDSILTSETECFGKSVLLAVVCDGMGGLEYGELASHMAVESFLTWFRSFWNEAISFPTKERVAEEIEALVISINVKIFEYATSMNVRMGTTISAVMLFDNEYVIAHVGDSRIYKSDCEGLIQITEDDSLVAKDVREGRITAEEAKRDKRRNILIRSVGVKRTITPQIMGGEVHQNDFFLICSDGLWNKTEIGELQREDISSIDGVNKLISKARSCNEKDNISVIVVMTEEEISTYRNNWMILLIGLVAVLLIVTIEILMLIL